MNEDIEDIEPQNIEDIEAHVKNIKKALDTEREFYQSEIIRLQQENINLRKEIQQIYAQWTTAPAHFTTVGTAALAALTLNKK